MANCRRKPLKTEEPNTGNGAQVEIGRVHSCVNPAATFNFHHSETAVRLAEADAGDGRRVELKTSPLLPVALLRRRPRWRGGGAPVGKAARACSRRLFRNSRRFSPSHRAMSR